MGARSVDRETLDRLIVRSALEVDAADPHLPVPAVVVGQCPPETPVRPVLRLHGELPLAVEVIVTGLQTADRLGADRRLLVAVGLLPGRVPVDAVRSGA